MGIPPSSFETSSAIFLLWRVPDQAIIKFHLTNNEKIGNDIDCAISLSYNSFQLEDVKDLFTFDELIKPTFLPITLQWNMTIPTQNIHAVERITIPTKGIHGLKIHKQKKLYTVIDL